MTCVWSTITIFMYAVDIFNVRHGHVNQEYWFELFNLFKHILYVKMVICLYETKWAFKINLTEKQKQNDVYSLYYLHRD